ncbi:sensory box/GGDEF domain protein [Pseudoalteromonas luteoviolacea B = ATCC 29581]|nr:sensory box/GGDEF domain protein [Pseudoalteromonas luteoviolacea B = ATCC 29581]
MPFGEHELEEHMFFGQLVSQCSPLELLKQLLMHSHHAVVITDADESNGHKIVYANNVFCKSTGYSLAELVGMSPRILQGPESNYEVIKKIKPELQQKGFFYGASINYRKDGSIYPVEWNISEIKDQQGKVTHYISIQKDLTNLKHLAQQVRSSNKVFKQFYLKHREQFKEDVVEAQEVVDSLIQNEKIYSAGLRDQDNCELFEEAFFDFSPGEFGALAGKEKKEKLSAENFLQDQPIDDSDLTSLLESIEEVDAEIGFLQSQGINKERVHNIASRFQEVANNLYFCIEFNDGALIIDEVAKRLNSMTVSDDFPHPFLVAFNREVYDWLKGVFVTKDCENVFEGESNTVAAGHQLLAFLS